MNSRVRHLRETITSERDGYLSTLPMKTLLSSHRATKHVATETHAGRILSKPLTDIRCVRNRPCEEQRLREVRLFGLKGREPRARSLTLP